MKFFVRILIIVVVFEAAAVSVILARRERPPGPAPDTPTPDLSHLDRVVADAINEREAAAASNTASAWLELSEAYTAYGLFPEAEQAVRHAIDLEPESFDPRFWLGIVLDRLGRREESIDAFRESLQFAPGEMADTCRHCIGRNLLRLERLPEAEQEFREADRLIVAAYELVRLMIRDGRAEETLPMLDPLIENVPDAHNVYQLRAAAHRSLGNEAAAYDDEMAAQRTPDMLLPDLVTKLIKDRSKQSGIDQLTLYAGQQDSPDPDDMDAQYLSLESEWNPEIATRLVQAEMSRGNPEAAIELLTRLRRESPPKSAVYGLLGDARQMAGDLAGATEAWHQAIELHGREVPHERLAAFYTNSGDSNLARRHSALALLEQGKSAWRGKMLESSGEFFEAATQLDPEIAHAWYYLGLWHRAMDSRQEAVQALNECLRRNPNHGRAIRALKFMRVNGNEQAGATDRNLMLRREHIRV